MQKRCLRTPFHVHHSIDIPSGEITIESTSTMKHYTRQEHKDVNDQMDGEKSGKIQ